MAELTIPNAQLICSIERYFINLFNEDTIENEISDYDNNFLKNHGVCKSSAVLIKMDMFTYQEFLLIQLPFIWRFSFLLFQFPSLKLLLLHNKKDFYTEQLLQTIFYTIASKHPDIILSNFNKNVFEKNDISTRLLFEGFKQIVSELTHMRHCCIKFIGKTYDFSTENITNYYSDHEWVHVRLKLNQM